MPDQVQRIELEQEVEVREQLEYLFVILTSPISLGLLTLALVIIFFWGMGIIIIAALETLFDFAKQYARNRRFNLKLVQFTPEEPSPYSEEPAEWSGGGGSFNGGGDSGSWDDSSSDSNGLSED